MEISRRLMAIADEIAFDTIADIGCDHGYIPIFACLRGQIKRAIACDIGSGPLEQAAKNIEGHGLSNRIETRQGSGLSPLREGEARTVVIAGLGGRLMIDILREAEGLVKQTEQLILQPQRDIPQVRRYIHAIGFNIINEIMVFEDGMYYNILNCRPSHSDIMEVYTPREYYLGKILIDRQDEALWNYVIGKREKLISMKKRICPSGDKNLTRLSEINEELEMLRL